MGEQKQRVSIIRVLLLNPEIILFDEPTFALDDKNRIKITNLIDKLRKSGYMVIVVTHDFKLLDNLNAKIFNINKY